MLKGKSQFILISLLLGFGLATTDHTAFAQKGTRIDVSLGATVTEQSVDISGDTIIIGAFPDKLAQIYTAGNNNTWKKEADFIGVDAKFGFSVDVSGQVRGKANVAIVGSPGAGGGGVENSGAAFIYSRTGSDWKQRGRITAPDAAEGDNFGNAVAIHRNTAVVGAPRDDDGGRDAGSVYIFVQGEAAALWDLQAKIVPDDLAGGDNFGDTLVIRENFVIIGAPGHTFNGIRFAGAVYIFAHEGETWVQQAKLTADAPEKGERYGTSVAISGDSMIIGAPLHDTDAGTDSGAAYIFVPDGDTWKQQAKLVPKDAGKSHAFGSGVAISPRIAIIGARGHNENERGVGAAYSFVRVDDVWQERKKIIPADGFIDLHFGFSVALNINTVVIAAHNIVNERLGGAHGDGAAAYVYNSVEDFETPPFAVEPFGLRLTTLGQVKHTALFQNFPNPFNPETWLPYRLAADAPVTLRIYNVQGQRIHELDLGIQKAGGYLTRETAAYWNGRDQVGETVSSGVYFYTLQAGSFQATRRMLILK